MTSVLDENKLNKKLWHQLGGMVVTCKIIRNNMKIIAR